jgi:hypothetical protein
MSYGRTYSDPSYGSRKTIELPETAVMNGTGTATSLDSKIKLMYPVTIKGFNLATTTAGTGAAPGDVVLGYETGGTGSFTEIGTATLTGTQAVKTNIDGSVTETNLSADDTLSVVLDGTAQDVSTVIPRVELIERFVQSDT